MINWLKYFFGNFFFHKYSQENERRSLLHCLLALALSFVLFLTGVYAGYVASFKTFLNNSSQFQQTVTQVFGQGGVQLTIRGGVAQSINDPRPIDTFNGVGQAPSTKMQVVVDTNDTATNFAQFQAYCVLNSDKNTQISYEEYLVLDKKQQAKYTFQVKNLGKPLEIDQQMVEFYNQHLQAACDKSSPFYKVDVAADYLALQPGDPNYNSRLHQLFVVSYYPSMKEFERYAQAPSMKTFYTQQIAKAETYLVVLDDMCFGRFKSNGGVTVDFSGYFDKSTNVVIDGAAQSNKQVLDGVNQLVLDAFNASKTNVMSVYLLNVIASFPIVVVAVFLVAVAMWFAIRKCHGDYGFGASVKTAFCYFFMASVITFILCFCLSFALPREAVYTLAVVGLFVTVLVRVAVFCVKECVSSRKAYRQMMEDSPSPNTPDD